MKWFYFFESKKHIHRGESAQGGIVPTESRYLILPTRTRQITQMSHNRIDNSKLAFAVRDQCQILTSCQPV